MRVSIGGPDWVELREVSELTRLDRRSVNASIVFEADPVSMTPIFRGSLDDDQATAVMACVITDWSLTGVPLPSVDTAVLDRLSLEQDNLLRAAIQPHLEALKGSNAPRPENEVPTKGSVS